MITKEFARIRLHAAPEAILAWLDGTAHAAARMSRRAYRLVPLEPDGRDEAPAAESLRYGLFAAGEMVLAAAVWRASAASSEVELRCSAAFPLTVDELADDLHERFSVGSAEVLAAPQHTDAGAPPLACNVWLEEELRRLPDPERQAHGLYEGWLERYIALRGAAPAEPRRSFRAAVRSRLDRIRGEPAGRRQV
jgi:hypothetical protein